MRGLTNRVITLIVGLLLLAGAVIPSLAADSTPADGVQVDWVRNYSSGNDPEFAFAYAVAADESGNVYVTGSSYGPGGLPDYATIKYSSSGDVLWVQRYHGPGDSWDAAHSLALDKAGNVYVTGSSYGSNDFDYVTIKYSPSGTQEWVARYDGPANSEDWATAIAVDSSSNTYVTGYSIGSGTFYDYATIKYDPSGAPQWVARYNGPGNTKDTASGVAVDLAGNVYVTGSSGEGSYNYSDYVTVKYDLSGVQRWVARYSNLYDYATSLAVDASGNAYVTGYSYGFGTFYDYATVKYDARGRQRWVARYHGGVGDDFAYALAVDGSGNVYVTGESVGPESGGSAVRPLSYGTIKYSPRGRQLWVARYDGPGVDFPSNRATAIAVDGSGNVYVTGESQGADLGVDYATVKYGTRGDEQWVVRYNGPEDTFDLASALAVDGTGYVYVTGRSNQLGRSEWTTIKYSQASMTVGQAGTSISRPFEPR